MKIVKIVKMGFAVAVAGVGIVVGTLDLLVLALAVAGVGIVVGTLDLLVLALVPVPVFALVQCLYCGHGLPHSATAPTVALLVGTSVPARTSSVGCFIWMFIC